MQMRNVIEWGLALMIHLKLTILFSVESLANGMICGMVRNFISRETNIVLKIY